MSEDLIRESGCGCWKMVNKGERMFKTETEQVLQDLADCGRQFASIPQAVGATGDFKADRAMDLIHVSER